jgi:hypothetical protein
MPRLLFLLLALAAAAPAEYPFGGAAALHGQAPKRSPVHPVRATVALVDRLPPLRQEYPAVILRQAGGGDVILLPRATATGELLDAAVRTLLLARAAQGNRPSTHRGRAFGTLTVGVRPARAPEAWAERYTPLAQRLVDQLRTAPSRRMEGIGNVPALDFFPPDPRA